LKIILNYQLRILNAHPHCFGFAIRYYLLSAFLMQKKQYIYILNALQMLIVAIFGLQIRKSKFEKKMLLTPRRESISKYS
jgi:hypothetical protein